MGKVTITNHPLIQHKLTLLRDKNTGSKEFRALVQEIAMLMCYEATRDLPLKEVEIEKSFPAKSLLLCRFSVPAPVCSAACLSWFRPQRSVISVCIVTPIP